ncbi:MULTISPECIES: hypothetical protein [Thermoanaerobacterium]|uniref:Uncharacterized protein n=3 Tax=Thermoanaerobacterium TaxID=28895 RepID=L0IQF3_THETR|nr:MULTISPECIES: hypothetical protein [Thermoanaerobacterium]AFK94266.1 hypothetical protein Tsac_2719 [Thermoanaerobacterium saccharolyticum JW/SL-YS485]AGB20441.1 hypothetical protein Thethe_02894 [Thermoanaerobacterium thermosaccharolyticum M0795]ETO39059.1 hypothetical protein V518_0766 [Thermoanaerobacterium aotearoense SCUT27]
MFFNIDDDMAEEIYDMLDNLAMLKILYDRGFDITNIDFSVTPNNDYGYYWDGFLGLINDLVFGDYIENNIVYYDKEKRMVSQEDEYSNEESIIKWFEPSIVAFIKKNKNNKDKIKEIESLLNSLMNEIWYEADYEIATEENNEAILFRLYYLELLPLNSFALEFIFEILDLCKKEVSVIDH